MLVLRSNFPETFPPPHNTGLCFCSVAATTASSSSVRLGRPGHRNGMVSVGELFIDS